MLDSMQKLCLNILDGLELPDAVPGPLKAWITPPVLERAPTPRAHVWGGRLNGRRQSGSRGAGLYKFNWTVDVYACWLTTPDNGLKNEPFPKVTDAIIKAFLAVPISQWVDEDGNIVGPNKQNPTDTQLQSIGEAIDADYPPEKTVSGPRMLWYCQRLGVTVMEVINA